MGNIKIQKWDPDKHCYEPHPYPDEWNVGFFSTDLDEFINCAQCGKKLPYGDAFTSRELYNSSGMFSMAICPKCHEAEWKREKKRRNKKWSGGEEQNEALEALRQQAPKVVSVDALYEALDKSEFIYLTKNDVRNIVEGLL